MKGFVWNPVCSLCCHAVACGLNVAATLFGMWCRISFSLTGSSCCAGCHAESLYYSIITGPSIQTSSSCHGPLLPSQKHNSKRVVLRCVTGGQQGDSPGAGVRSKALDPHLQTPQGTYRQTVSGKVKPVVYTCQSCWTK